MDFLIRHNSLDSYLKSSEIIDYEDPKILFAAQMLMEMRTLQKYGSLAELMEHLPQKLCGGE